MTLTRRRLLGTGTAFAAFGAAAHAQDTFPTRPVLLIIPFPRGGPSDLLGRLVGQRLRDLWRQPVVVENRPGASGSIGALLVAQAPPDGYTLVLGNNASNGAYEVLNPRQAPYRTTRDFAPVALIGVAPLVMVVNPQVPARSLTEFVAFARANRGRLNYASSAFGSAPHLACELLNLAAGIDMTLVGYNGAAPALLAIANGDVHVYMGGVSSVMPFVNDGRARAIAAVSAQRIAALPDLPTAAEQGIPGVEWDSWFGLLAPAGVPAPILDKINVDVRRVLDGDDVRVQRFGVERKLGDRNAFLATIEAEIARTTRVARDARIKVE